MNPLRVVSLAVGPFAANCYLLVGRRSLLVIDPGGEPDRIRHQIHSLGLPPAAYLLTHGHPDHIGALPDLLTHLPAPVLLSPQDADWAFSAANAIPPWYEPPRRCEARIRDIGRERLPGEWCTIRILPTPGHTPGSICIWLKGALFSGDTLFAGGVGRTDLPRGDPAKLQESLRRLAELDPNTRVWPGHGPPTTIGREILAGVLRQARGKR